MSDDTAFWWGIFGWMKYIVVQYWGWFLVYIIPILAGFYIAYWRDRQGEESHDLWLECIFWPVTLAGIIVFRIIILFGYVVTHIVDWIDSLILIIARHKIHSDETGELWRSPAPNSELYAQWVKVKDKTGVHWIQVPLSIKTARDGIAWTYSLEGNEYHPTVRT